MNFNLVFHCATSLRIWETHSTGVHQNMPTGPQARSYLAFIFPIQDYCFVLGAFAQEKADETSLLSLYFLP